jgi:ABC-type enterobactin transport system permease subunit
MPETSILRTALYILGAALLLCLGGIIWLSSANPARSIPDVLVATTGLVSGGLVGILVPTKSATLHDERGQTNIVGAVIGLLLVVLLIFLILRIA